MQDRESERARVRDPRHHDQRPDPDALLARLRADDAALTTPDTYRDAAGSGAGVLHVFLGAAPGVGKTLAMLHDAHRLKAAGVDVVVGLIETHGRAQTAAAIGDLDQVPLLQLPYRGVLLSEPDIDALLARKPQVVLLDELAHTNAPGSVRQYRWQDAQLLLAAGIRVHTTLNVQHLDSVRDIVEAVSGVAVREAVPDALLEPPTVVHLIDLPPEDLRERLRAGLVYPPDRARQALDGFFRADTLTALRELALRQAAEGVERDLSRFMHDYAAMTALSPTVGGSLRNRSGSGIDGDPAQAVAGVLACFGSGEQADRVLRHAWRMAAAIDANLHALHVARQPLASLPDTERRNIERDIQLAEDLGATVQILVLAGSRRDIVSSVLQTAYDCHAACIVLGHTLRSRWQILLGRSLAHELLRHARGIDIHIVTRQRRHSRL